MSIYIPIFHYSGKIDSSISGKSFFIVLLLVNIKNQIFMWLKQQQQQQLKQYSKQKPT